MCVFVFVCWTALGLKARSTESQCSDGVFRKRALFCRLGYIDKCDKCSPSEVLPPAISVTVSGRMLKLDGYNK